MKTNERDKKVMELMEKKTPGKWEYSSYGIITCDKNQLKGVAQTWNKSEDDFNNNENNGKFIAESSTGWPKDFFERLLAERMAYLMSLNFQVYEKKPANEVYREYLQKALASLDEEGIKFPNDKPPN